MDCSVAVGENLYLSDRGAAQQGVPRKRGEQGHLNTFQLGRIHSPFEVSAQLRYLGLAGADAGKQRGVVGLRRWGVGLTDYPH